MCLNVIAIPEDPTLAERAGDTHAIYRAGEPLGVCPGRSPGNGHIESFNAKLRDELFIREIFFKLQEAQVPIERWRNQKDRRRPHSSLGNRPPTLEAFPPPFLRSPATAAPAFGLKKTLVQKLGAGQPRVTVCRIVTPQTCIAPWRAPSATSRSLMIGTSTHSGYPVERDFAVPPEECFPLAPRQPFRSSPGESIDPWPACLGCY